MATSSMSLPIHTAIAQTIDLPRLLLQSLIKSYWCYGHLLIFFVRVSWKKSSRANPRRPQKKEEKMTPKGGGVVEEIICKFDWRMQKRERRKAHGCVCVVVGCWGTGSGVVGNKGGGPWKREKTKSI
jgi:hypothetical protein